MVDNPDRGPVVLGVCIAMLSLSTLFVIGRMISKLMIVKRRTWDDYLILAAWMFGVAISACLIWGTKNGLGKHDNNVAAADTVALRRAIDMSSILYSPALMFTKLSILVFYLTLTTVHKPVRWTTWIFIIIVLVSGLALTFLLAFQCEPAKWLFSSNPAHEVKCIGLVDIYILSAPANIVTDVAILLIPMPIIIGLRLPFKQKAILLFTFLLGIFATVVDIIRLYYLQQAIYDSTGELMTTGIVIGGETDSASIDLGYHGSFAYMWSIVEVQTGIMCGCIPTLKPLVQKIMPTLIYSARRGSHKESSTSNISSRNAETALSKSSDITKSSGHTESSFSAKLRTKLNLFSQLSKRNRTFVTFQFDKTPKMTHVNRRASIKYAGFMIPPLLFIGFSLGFLAFLYEITSLERRHDVYVLMTIYYSTYLAACPTLGLVLIRRLGFQQTWIIGFMLIALGLIIMWPSTLLFAMGGFMTTNVIAGIGFALVSLGAYSHPVLCGPTSRAATRLCFISSLFPLGDMFSLILGQHAIFPSGSETPLQWNLQWIYLSLFFAFIIFACIYFYLPLPCAKDDDFADRDAKHEIIAQYHQQTNVSYRKKHVINITMGLGLCCLLLNNGISGLYSASTTPFLLLSAAKGYGIPSLTTFQFGMIAAGVPCAVRILAGFCSQFLRPRLLLLFFFSASLGSTIATAVINENTNAASYLIIVNHALIAPIWPLAYALTITGMGRKTTLATSLAAATNCGGGIWLWLAYDLMFDPKYDFSNLQLVPPILTGTSMLFAIYINLEPYARRRIDGLCARGFRGERETEETVYIGSPTPRSALFDQAESNAPEANSD